MNKREKQLAILNVLRINKVGIGALLENKLKKEKIDDMMIKLFCGWDYYSSSNSEGRILVLWWKSFTKVQVLFDQHQLVQCSIKITGMPMEYLVTFVYGLNTLEERLELWRGLSSIHVINRPWLIMGDFNAVFNFDERVGGRTISAAELIDSNAWLTHSQLVSIKRIGSNFTWSNKQDGEDRIYSKIDHVFINEDWIDALPHSIAEFHWEAFSDHCYCLIKSLKMGSLVTKPFRFFNFWTTHRGFKEVVLDNWNKPLAARGLLGVTTKILRLKHVLKSFSREEIGDVEQRYHQAKGDYQLALTRAQVAPSDLAAQEAVKSAAIQYQDYADRGYMGSSSSANGSFNVQCMEFGTCLDIELQLRLTRDFGKFDIKKALLSIPSVKSLGPDGIGSEFYKTMWLDIGDSISDAVLGFFRDGKIPEALNETALALVPKTDSPSRVVNYRPIA
ncbi:uncharacterized protein LOC133778398 [Humulus lupulus]|uniref:uncharacterized protein LOC133778398 n=1 Tax=Humulus lupulus TaxID=3486 RepID=UPI002B401037|nr:uncharacterized protein LOC133778398 [Humulus lupulus]